jgi:hypothetical protein
MNIQVRRLALATAILWFFGGGDRAEASLALLTPGGLSPGEHFRFAFVTDGTTTALSSNIASYDSYVNNQAGGATYNGVGVSWLAIGSTATVNAIDHVGISTDPVFLVDGTKVAASTDTAGLWSGSLLHALNEYISGAPVSLNFLAWTGTTPGGTADTLQPLGSNQGVRFGVIGSVDSDWVDRNPSFADTQGRLYGISADLVVPGVSAVPEPSSLWIAGIAISGGLAYGWSRRRA